MKDVVIKSYYFTNESFEELHDASIVGNSYFEKNLLSFLRDWPVVYLLKGSKKIYVGQSNNFLMRIKNHLSSDKKSFAKEVAVIFDKTANTSYTLHMESSLIRLLQADSTFEVDNKNNGSINRSYYQRDTFYDERLEKFIWPKLKEMNIVTRDFFELQNDDVYKYSPFIPLATDQYDSVVDILRVLSKTSQEGSFLIEGGAGTGKTVIGIFLLKLFLDKERYIYSDDTTSDLNYIKNVKNIRSVAFVVPQSSLRKTLKRVFRKIPGLSSKDVLSPTDVVNSGKFYDLLLVDEAHRLRRRKNISQYASFDKSNRLLGFGNEGTELDWILKKSRNQIFFYDKGQSVKPTDISHDFFFKQVGSFLASYKLTSQFRVQAGSDYLDFLRSLFSCDVHTYPSLSNYSLELFDSISDLRREIFSKNSNSSGKSRLLAGYAWDWNSRKDGSRYDIFIENEKFKWNSKLEDWLSFEELSEEVGCVHTIQGYDLEYAGVIIGPELSYDEKNNKLIVIKKNYKDRNGKASIEDPEFLEEYIKNIYIVLLSRGIKGTYIYVCDPKLREYFKKHFSNLHSNIALDSSLPVSVAEKNKKKYN